MKKTKIAELSLPLENDWPDVKLTVSRAFIDGRLLNAYEIAPMPFPAKGTQLVKIPPVQIGGNCGVDVEFKPFTVEDGTDVITHEPVYAEPNQKAVFGS